VVESPPDSVDEVPAPEEVTPHPFLSLLFT